jgi:hypothetical protein
MGAGFPFTRAWNYTFLYELLPRWFPGVPEQAQAIGGRRRGGRW